MKKRTILLSTAVLFVGVTAFAAFAQFGNGNAKRIDKKRINSGLYFDTRSLCEDKSMKEGC